VTQIAPSDAVEAADPQSGPSAAAPGPGSGLGDPDLKLMLRVVSLADYGRPIAMWAWSRSCVPSSLAPIRREYPATSAARIAVRRRTEGICRRRSTVLTKPTPKSVPTLAFSGLGRPQARLRRRVAVSGGSPAPAPRSARGGVPVLFRTLCPLHATAASTTPAAITAATHVRAAIARIGSVRCWSLARWPLGAPGKRQYDE
jgi:hypothetical protein